MRRLPQNLSLLAVSVFSIAVIAVAPVSARQGSDDSASTSSSVTTESSSGSGPSSTKPKSADDSVRHTETETEHGVEVEAAHRSGDLKEGAQKLLATERQDKKGKSIEDRQKSCTARQASLTKKTDNYTRNATKHLEKFNSIYDKVLAFQVEKQLTATNYEELKAAVDAKKAAATGAVASLSGLDVAIDCTVSDPAAAVATLKTGVKNARMALHDYRTAIKNLVVALQAVAANESTDSSTEAN